VANSDDVPIEAIFRGKFAEVLRKNRREKLKSQLVLTDFGTVELKEFYSQEHLAYEVWKAMAALRSVGKGAGLHATGYDFHDARSDELDFLVEQYDTRRRAFISSATGTIFDSRTRDSEGWIFLPGLNSERIPISKFDRVLRTVYGFELEGIPGDTELASNFVWEPFNIRSFWKSHEPFAAAFLSRHKVRLDVVLSVVATLAIGAFLSWKDVGKFWQLWQRAYEGPFRSDLILEHLKDKLSFGLSALDLSESIDDSELQAAFGFLALPSDRGEVIDIGAHGPHSMFLPYDDKRAFIDYAHIRERLFWLFHGVNLQDQNFKGSALEVYVRDRPNVLPSKPCKAPDGTAKQVDASFRLGNVLIIVECKVKARSLGFERGDPVAISQRNQFIDDALREVDQKAIWLANRPVGLNYDISEFGWILPVVVTPFVEFIGKKDAYYWIDPQTPRVMTPQELQTILSDGAFDKVAPYCQCTHPIVGRLEPQIP
jgi:hypothetical protein